MMAYLHSLSTSLPPHLLPQTLVQDRAQAILGPKYPQFERLLKTFTTSGIKERYSVVPLSWFEEDHGWADRNKAYIEGALALFIAAATKALATADWLAEEVDCVITVSSTGIATPTLEALALTALGFSDHVIRIPVFGLGCAGGVSGLSLAADMAQARPGTKVLLVVVETCTLLFRNDRLQKSDIIATVLFGDGAAAACVSTTNPDANERVVVLGKGYQKTWPDTLSIMGWDVDNTGLGVIFDRSIPVFVEREFKGALDGALTAFGLERGEIDHFVCHPGGAKVVDALETVLELDQGALLTERETLRHAGNMSAPTVLFVLKRVLDDGAEGKMIACALGPGFTASFIPVTVGKKVG
ncbi:MAG: type III polyketide synthase [Rhizobiales bacterium]|nr:type III polyketide synthase [Hyphomicrobiales bacterium]